MDILQLKLPVTRPLISIGYQSLHCEEIQKYLNKIRSKHNLDNKKNDLANLYNHAFWQQCIEQKPKVSELAREWSNLKWFATFSVSGMLKHLQNTVRPLEIAILRAMQEIQIDLEYYNKFGIWRAGWYVKQQQMTLSTLQQYHLVLEKYKHELARALLDRCTGYSLENYDGHEDARLEYFCMKFNETMGSQVVSVPKKSMIADDDRIEIYDWLCEWLPDRAAEFEIIIKPTRKRGFNKLIAQSEVETENKKLLDFCESIEKAHKLTPLSVLRQSLATQDASKKPDDQNGSMLTSVLKKCYQLRYVLFLILTCGSYYLFQAPILSVLIPLVPSVVLASNIAFYGFALLPLWIFALSSIFSAFTKIVEYFTYAKKQQMHQALEFLKAAQGMVSSILSCGVLDTAHFNILRLEKNTLIALQRLHQFEISLPKSRFVERIFMPKQMQLNIKKILHQMAQQKLIIQHRLKLWASHLVERLAEDLALLKLDLQKGIMPHIGPEQIKICEHFIHKHGDPKAQQDLKRICTLFPQFIEALRNKDMIVEEKIHYLNVPWGGFKPYKAGLHGWYILLSHFSDLDKHTLSLLMNCLHGKVVKQYEIQRVLTVLNHHDPRFSEAFQQYVFDCLDHLPHSMVHFLSQSQKNSIAAWYHKNKFQIQEAENAISVLVDNHGKYRGGKVRLTCAKVANYVSLLDNSLIAYELLALDSPCVNKIRYALTCYDGSLPDIFTFVHFFDEKERPNVAAKIAEKRLNWMLQNPARVKLSNADKEIFLSPYIRGNKLFRLVDFVKKHQSSSEPYFEPLQKLFQQFRDGCIDGGELLKLYRWQHASAKNDPIRSRRIPRV